jgi:predicted aspartyl protease/GNAT superfamily N-acetyltransferase
MTLEGQIRDKMPRVSLDLPGADGEPLAVEMIVDTAFDGDLALPADVVTRLRYFSPSVRRVRTATGDIQEASYVTVLLSWDDEERVTEVMVSDAGAPLLGVDLLREHALSVVFAPGGEVLIEPTEAGPSRSERLDTREILDRYDREVRRGGAAGPGFRVEATDRLVRHVGPDGESFILYTRLAEGEADAVIAEQTAYFRGLGHTVEWKTFAHDTPVDLGERLERAGWEPGDEEALVVFDLAADPLPAAPPGVVVRRLEDPAEVAEVERVQDAVWGDGHLPWLADWLRAEMTERPDAVSVFTARVADAEAGAGSVGWVTYSPDNSFAGLWGGSTLPEHRGRGLYRALVAARLAEARARPGVRFATVDALPTSRPILERLGFRRLTETRPYVLPAPV